MGETGCGKTCLIRYMCGLQSGPGGPKNMLLMKVRIRQFDFFALRKSFTQRIPFSLCIYCNQSLRHFLSNSLNLNEEKGDL